MDTRILPDFTPLSAENSVAVPVLSTVDVLVIGATSTAVAAALEVTAGGRSAMVVGDLSYLGSDLAGRFQLWPGPWRESDPLLRAAFAESASRPARPGAIKRSLEEALLAARIPFLFQSRPISILRDDSGVLSGVVLAVRTSLLAVMCRSIIDASDHGVGARLLDLPLVRREAASSLVEWTVLGKNVPAGWPGTFEKLEPALVQSRPEGESTYTGYRLQIARDKLGDDPRAAEHVARALLVNEDILVTADLLAESPTDLLATPLPLKNQVSAIDVATMQIAPGFWIANDLLPLSMEGLQDLRQPDQMIGLGRRIGAEAAACLSDAQIGKFHTSSRRGDSGDYRFAPVFLRGDRAILNLASLEFPTFPAFDVVVSGGGTGGAPAGIAAARSGANTLVLEMQHGLGGVGTLGLISSYWFGNRVGFTAELNAEVSRFDSWSRAKDGESWKPGVKSAMYHRMLHEAGGRAWTGSFAFGVKMEGDRVAGLLVSTPFGSGLVACGAIIDATGNSDIAAAAGAPCRVIGADHVAVQGAGMSSRAHPEVSYQNSDHTFIDDADPIGVTSAFVHARAKYPRDFDTVSMVNSRERRQILGEQEVSPLDILAGRTFPDTVFVAYSNFDTHGFTVHPVFMLAPPDHDPIRANVPYRCMLPRGIDGVLVTGLSMSAHRDALPLLRMQADVQNQGYVAGLAAAEAVAKNHSLRDLDIRALQRQLADCGILETGVLEETDSFPMSLEAVEQAAQSDLEKLTTIAVLLAHPEQSLAPLREVMANDPSPRRRHDAARLLGMMGDALAGPVLAEIIRTSSWDEGWNYRGMGQFGSSMSWLDSVIIAFGRAGCESDSDAIETKIRELDANSEFSHFRAVALAAAMRPDARLAGALGTLLSEPGIQGHALRDLDTIRAGANPDPNETSARNLSLREIYLAMGLFLSGDPRGLGRKTLESYADDLRGQFARYSRALLAHPDHDALRGHLA